MANTCYLCGAPRFSGEHVPARCFFPEDPAYRKNLIKVSSCKNHNEDTSKDDEYVRNIICMSVGTNAVAFKQFIDKVLESFSRSSALANMTFHNTKQVYLKDEKDNFKQTFAFEIDRIRFDRVMKKIGYALYYHEYGSIWKRGLIVATDCLLEHGMQKDELGALIQYAKRHINIPSFDGQNPQVFQYKFMETEGEDVILWIRFYEAFDVFLIPNTTTSQPDDINIKPETDVHKLEEDNKDR